MLRTHGKVPVVEDGEDAELNLQENCRRFPLRFVEVLFPWALAVLIGFATSLTGVFIAWNCEYLSDLRFGTCQGLSWSDRNRCCGGADNIDFSHEQCKQPRAVMDDASLQGNTVAVDWVPWERWLESEFAAFVIYVATTVLLSGLAAFIVHAYCPPAKGSGIPNVKATVSGFFDPASFSAMCLLIKALGLSMVVGAGLSLGKEGPLIHIGVCWACMLRAKRGPLSPLTALLPLHEVVCVGAAAGVSTAFGAPLGGVLFAVEELGSVRALSSRGLLLAFAGSFAASLTLKTANLNGLNRLTFFSLSTPTHSAMKEWRAWEIMLFLILGILGGLGGAFFVKLNTKIARRRRRYLEKGRLWMLSKGAHDALMRCLPRKALRHDDPPRLTPGSVHVLEAVFLGFTTAAVNYPLSHLLRFPMVEVIHALFEKCPHSKADQLGLCDAKSWNGYNSDSLPLLWLWLAAIIRLLQTAMTFGVAVPSGLFIPSLFVGALLGRFVGQMTLETRQAVMGMTTQSAIEPGVYAMVGAIAMLSGFARMTVSIVVIMFELTGELVYVVPFMCAVLAAKQVGDIFTDSIYDEYSVLLGYAMIEPSEEMRLELTVGDIAVGLPEVDVVEAGNPASRETLQSFLVPRNGTDPALLRRAASLRPVSSAPPAQTRAASSVFAPQAEVFGLRLDAADNPEELEAPASHRSSSSRSDSGTPSAASCAARNESQEEEWRRPDYAGYLVLVKDARSRIAQGVVEKDALRAWLHERELSLYGVSFEPLPFSEPDQPKPDDASSLLEVNIVRLRASAPVLTAVCAFQEHPHVQYCVVRPEEEGDALRVVSRSDMEAALTSRRFPAAFREEGRKAPPAGEVLRAGVRRLSQVWGQVSGAEAATLSEHRDEGDGLSSSAA